MIRSKHFETRTNQRGIPQKLVEVVYEHGKLNHKGRTTLSKKEALTLMPSVDREHQRMLKKIIDKGGLELIEKEGVLITAYRLERRALRRAS